MNLLEMIVVVLHKRVIWEGRNIGPTRLISVAFLPHQSFTALLQIQMSGLKGRAHQDQGCKYKPWHMLTNNLPLSIITHELLSSLEKTELLDLLLHKTQLYIAANNSKIADKEYYHAIQKEVELIQQEIIKRRD